MSDTVAWGGAESSGGELLSAYIQPWATLRQRVKFKAWLVRKYGKNALSKCEERTDAAHAEMRAKLAEHIKAHFDVVESGPEASDEEVRADIASLWGMPEFPRKP